MYMDECSMRCEGTADTVINSAVILIHLRSSYYLRPAL
jgi:hypothetical protein